MSSPIADLFAPLALPRGPAMKNRFMLAPLTNLQSHPDGQLSDDERRWLVMRAEGGFGAVMTCAAHVQREGQGFPGQLGFFDDVLLPGLTGLAAGIKRQGAVALAQLHHAGMRSPPELIGQVPLSPSDDAETGARAMSEAEVEASIEAFIAAAVRAERAGFDGVELHGAHGYLICQFLSAETNRRDDRFGGSLENRARMLAQIIAGVRARCRPDFILGVRLSPERFGLQLGEMRDLAGRLMAEAAIDFLDLSLWNARKEPEEEAFKGRPLIGWFTDLPRGDMRLGAAGRILTPAHAHAALEAGADFVLLGRAAILHHDYPRLVAADPAFLPVATPVSAERLAAEGLGPAFIAYMRSWAGFVTETETQTETA